MRQYKIPQNIGIQDKIVGPFTLRQLIIVAVGGGTSYVIFLISSKVYELNVIEYFFIAIPFLLSLAFALVKVNNVTFFRFLLLALEFSIKPKKRHWDHRSIVSIVDPNLTESSTSKKDDKKAPKASEKERKNVNLDDLTKILDSGGFENVKSVEHKDIDSVKDDNLVAQAFFGHKKDQSKTQNMYWRTIDSQKKRLDIMSKAPSPKKQVKINPKDPASSEEKNALKSQEKMTDKKTPEAKSKTNLKIKEDQKEDLQISQNNSQVQPQSKSSEAPKPEVADQKAEGRQDSKLDQAEAQVQKITEESTQTPEKPEPFQSQAHNSQTSTSASSQLSEEGDQKKESALVASSASYGEVDYEKLKEGETIEFNLD